ncbi:MAG: anaerobic sulfatase-maturation protein [Bacteroidales bacterium]|nr:anaerobic sulfatase-maturation protein [Candidatus Physcousia equi]
MNFELSRPLYVMLKPIGAHCNLACKYCYYLEKSELYPETNQHLLSDETLERFIRDYIEAQTSSTVLFTWHGGETMMRPIAFYERALQLQRHYACGRQIDNCIQTNGTLITPEWARFLHDNNWLVGVSIDGPQEFHDEYRRHRDGRPSWAKVMRGIDMLNKYQVEWNAMAVVNDYNADYPLDFYRFFRDELGCRYLQFTPIVETRNGEQMTPESVTPQQWGNFLCSIFDEWVKRDIGEMFLQIFDATLANWMGVQPGLCTMAAECGHAGVMEWNGDVYSCDHFVFPQHRLGNIRQQTIYQLMNAPQQQEFARMKKAQLPEQCRTCQWQFACHGECPKNRIIDPKASADALQTLNTPQSSLCSSILRAPAGSNLNYLCAGYRQFFAHSAPYMDRMKETLLKGGEARDILRE